MNFERRTNPMNLLRPLAVAAALAGVAALPAAAQATTFCVGAPAGCTGTAVTAANLETGALQAAGLNDGVADEIVLAAGTFTETADGTWTVGSGLDPLTIRGAGSDQTTLTSAGTGNQYVVNLGGSGGHPVTVQDLRVLVPASFPNGPGYGAGVLAIGDTLERVKVESANNVSGGITAQGNTTLRDLEANLPGGTAVSFGDPGGTLTVEDSTIAGGSGISTSGGGTAHIRRVSLAITSGIGGAGSGTGVGNSASTVTVSDTLIVLSCNGANVSTGISTSGSAQAATTTADHLTIVEGSGNTTVGLSSFVAGGQPGNATTTVSNSILRGLDLVSTTNSPAGGGIPKTVVRDSNTPSLGAPTGDGVVEFSDGNHTLDPKFVAPASGDYRLAAGSPSIDAANPAHTTGTTDLDGAARSQDGDDDGTATPDEGAYERAGMAPPPPDGGGPGPGGDGPGPDPAGSDQTGDASNPPAAVKTCKVPKLKGLSVAKAEKRLKRAGCKRGRVTRPRGLHGKPKLVVHRQSKSAGRVVPLGTKVGLRLKVRGG
jgi:PASTA domain-containing protein